MTLNRRKSVRQLHGARRPLVESVEPRLLLAVFEVTNTFDAGPGSFREAIIQANHPEAGVEPEHIVFRIPGAGVPRISPVSPLPTITDNIVINGLTESGTPGVEINGGSAGVVANGLTIASSDPVRASEISGLIINHFSADGISITGNSNVVTATWIGTDATGTRPGPGNGGHGIRITSNGNSVGECVIGYNGRAGIAVVGNATGNDLHVNRFAGNGGLPIDLGDDGRTPNDPLDADTGPNDLQNHPVITVLSAQGGGALVQGSIHTTPLTTVEIVLYTSDEPDELDLIPVHQFEVETDEEGVADFSETVSEATPDTLRAASAQSVRFDATEERAVVNTSELFITFIHRPLVVGAFVGGTQWTDAFKQELAEESLGDANHGFDIWTGDEWEQPLPWSNVNRIAIRFNRGMMFPTREDLSITSAAGIQYGVASFAYDPATEVGVWTLDKPLAGFSPFNRRVADLVTLSIERGEQRFFRQVRVVPGDANRTGNVSPTDYGSVAAAVGRSTDDEGAAPRHYTVFRDVNANGNVSPTDVGMVRGNTGASAPAPPPVIPTREEEGHVALTDGLL